MFTPQQNRRSLRLQNTSPVQTTPNSFWQVQEQKPPREGDVAAFHTVLRRSPKRLRTAAFPVEKLSRQEADYLITEDQRERIGYLDERKIVANRGSSSGQHAVGAGTKRVRAHLYQ